MYTTKICAVCKNQFQPTSGAQKRCSGCRRIAEQKNSAERWRKHHHNRCNTCGIEIEQFKRFCKEHREKRLVCVGFLQELQSKNRDYERIERMMKLNDSIIRSQQKQIEELLERNQELRKEKYWLEGKIELLEVNQGAEFNRSDSIGLDEQSSSINRLEKLATLRDF